MTAYVRNVWYMAAWADEIAGEALFSAPCSASLG